MLPLIRPAPWAPPSPVATLDAAVAAATLDAAVAPPRNTAVATPPNNIGAEVPSAWLTRSIGAIVNA